MKRQSSLAIFALILVSCEPLVSGSVHSFSTSASNSLTNSVTSASYSSISVDKYQLTESQWQEAFVLTNYHNLVMDLNFRQANLQDEDFTIIETKREKISISENLIKMEKPGDKAEKVFTKAALMTNYQSVSGQDMNDEEFLNYLTSFLLENENNTVRQEGERYYLSTYLKAEAPRYYGTYNKGYCYRFDYFEKTLPEEEIIYRMILRDYEEMYIYRQPIKAIGKLAPYYINLRYDSGKHCYVLEGYASEYIGLFYDSLLAMSDNKVEFYFENGVLNAVKVLLTATHEYDGEYRYDYEIVLSEREQVSFDFPYNVVDCEHQQYASRLGAKAHIHFEECVNCGNTIFYETHSFENDVCVVCNWREVAAESKLLKHLW